MLSQMGWDETASNCQRIDLVCFVRYLHGRDAIKSKEMLEANVKLFVLTALFPFVLVLFFLQQMCLPVSIHGANQRSIAGHFLSKHTSGESFTKLAYSPLVY